ncbi:MAG: DNA-directed RNA polymerase subunit K [Candidatus Diapherotrites archaeon]|nr:DNA-directed RNA polymerase subunit K [Candidatus Diapherotrites archaeon]
MKLTRFEETRLISARALQLSLGAPPLVKPAKEISIFELAKEEFRQSVLPLAVLREYPDGSVKKIEAF